MVAEEEDGVVATAMTAAAQPPTYSALVTADTCAFGLRTNAIFGNAAVRKHRLGEINPKTQQKLFIGDGIFVFGVFENLQYTSWAVCVYMFHDLHPPPKKFSSKEFHSPKKKIR